MAVIVIIGVIVSVFTILYFSPLDAAYSILGQNATTITAMTIRSKIYLTNGCK
jgi:ABC-type dipeptide/oligopeptide/nickel transport system permease component